MFVFQRDEASGNGSNMMDSSNEDDGMDQGCPRCGSFNEKSAMGKNADLQYT